MLKEGREQQIEPIAAAVDNLMYFSFNSIHYPN